MLILHGSWLDTALTAKSRGFVLWAETDRSLDKSMRAGSQMHPFCAAMRAIRRVLGDLLSSTEIAIKRAGAEFPAMVWLPSVNDMPQASTALWRAADETAPSPLQLAAWQVEAMRFEPRDIPGLLAALPGDDDETPGVQLGSDLKYWRAAGKFVLELIARQRFMPTLIEREGQFLAVWEPLYDQPDDRVRYERLVKAMPPVCRGVVARYVGAPPNYSPRALLENMIAGVVDDFVRRHSALRSKKSSSYYGDSPGTIVEAWLAALTDPSPVVRGSDADLRAFYQQYRAWLEPIPDLAGGDAFRLCFRLDPPPARDGDELRLPKPNARDWTLRYFFQAIDDPSLLVPAEQVWQARGGALKLLKRKVDAPQEQLLAGLGQASRLFPPIEASLRSAHPADCALTADEAYSFVRETALLLESFGFGVLVPGLNTKLGVRLRLKSGQREMPKGGVAGITLDSLVEYDWRLALGEVELTREEFEKLAAFKSPLVQIRGQWVELRPEQLQQALRFWEKRKDRVSRESNGAHTLTAQEALRLALGLEPDPANAGLPVDQVIAEGWIADLVNELKRTDKLETIPVPTDFNGELRHYQVTGLAWLAFLRRWGLGGCLADDMGLGKTPQTIALLLHQRVGANGHGQPTLVVCPTSVVSNWQRELERFAPSLRVYAHHGASRKKTDFAEHAEQHDVVISSYSLLRRDEKLLAQVNWADVILDEAQNIKNASTKQAQAVRKLGAQWRLALTGTPVENRLSELWSIFQFLNPGYLGSEPDFQRHFANPIERAGDEGATKQLKALTRPFILRRVKTDPTVISDLPAKNEMKVWCNLTREQATLYEAVVRESLKRIEQAEGIERRGIVLATIMKLKQVSNHPAHFLADGSSLPGRSGKLARLTEMLEEARTVRERALVFTQFAEMGKLLQTHLQDVYGDEVLFLHGGTPTKTRTEMIDRFQNDPHGPLVFILSIKAGGTGVNLTRANHVFHFDRWWNPAVENQATDRAFRIGQTRNVQVYKYICAGTFEEQIDAMIERKKELASSIVGASEAWITELSTQELRELFMLRKEAVGD